uniref:Uncharacterized protein n=1 Tax=Knipowitschia caucasica TaxID=637954 RepID=A0AAV2L9A6_KNICA
MTHASKSHSDPFRRGEHRAERDRDIQTSRPELILTSQQRSLHASSQPSSPHLPPATSPSSLSNPNIPLHLLLGTLLPSLSAALTPQGFSSVLPAHSHIGEVLSLPTQSLVTPLPSPYDTQRTHSPHPPPLSSSHYPTASSSPSPTQPTELGVSLISLHRPHQSPTYPHYQHLPTPNTITSTHSPRLLSLHPSSQSTSPSHSSTHPIIN